MSLTSLKTRLFMLTLCLLISCFSLATDFDSLLDAQRPDEISDEQWAGLKAAVFDQKLTASEFENIGITISLDPMLDQAVLGAPDAQDNGAYSGAAYVFELENGNWVEKAKLTAADGTAFQHFGKSVAIENKWVVVGAPGPNANVEGHVYTYFNDGKQWSQVDKLSSGDVNGFSLFGESVRLINEKLVVGDYFAKNQSNLVTGAVYIFDYDAINSQWSGPAKVTAVDGDSGDHFGQFVDLDASATRLAVSAENDDDNGSNSGAVYIFDLIANSWVQSAKLTGSNITTNAAFGQHVAISDDGQTVVARANFPASSAAIYVFEFINNQWQETEILSAPEPASVQFGHSLDVSNDHIVVGRLDDPALFVYKKVNGDWLLEQNITTGVNIGLYDVDIQGERMLAASVSVGAIFYEYLPSVRSQVRGGPCQITTCQWSEEGLLDGTQSSAGDAFGVSVAVAGNYAIIGAHNDDTKGNNAGAAYIFKLNGNQVWNQAIKLTASDGQAGAAFGRAVAIDDGRAVVGAFTDDHFDNNVNIPNAGSVYVFDLDDSSWSESEKITAGEGAMEKEDRFGFSVDIDADRILIGAYSDDENGSDAGAAYVFDLVNNAWVKTEKIMPLDGNNDDAFGYAVSLAGDQALVGAYLNDEVATDTGAAYIYQYDSISSLWQLQDKLLPVGSGHANDYFGTAVSLDGDHALIGAYFDDTMNTNDDKGSVYFFQKDLNSNNWNQQQVLTASDGEVDDRFGYAVSLQGNSALIGSWLDDDNGLDSGSAYLYKLNANTQLWYEQEKVTAGDGVVEDFFGVSTGLFDEYLFIGANRTDQPETNAGSVYIFKDDVIFIDGFE